jgi:XTP/dITP diphosphohydrolase
MHRLLIASNNPDKLEELLDLLKDLDLQVVTPRQLGLELEVQEDGTTYAENAGKKALAFARAGRLVSIADDTGLEVDALEGAPGLFSKRYAPDPGATDADRRRLLLHNLRRKRRPWRAAFRATIAIATPEGTLRLAEGLCGGEIITQERGSGGFGYDAIFVPDGTGKTIAEMSMEEKNRISHRARAVQSAVPMLLEVLRTRS